MTDWPETARVAAIAAVDKRALESALDISVNDTWLMVTDILNATAPLIRDEALRSATREQAEAAMRVVVGEQMQAEVSQMVAETTDRVMGERLAVTEALVRASERERIAAWLERDAARLDESGFNPAAAAPVAASYRAAAEVIRNDMLEGP